MAINTTTVIFILFNLTIFALLVIQLAQLLTSFLLPFLRSQIKAVNQAWVGLTQKLSLLKTTEKKLENDIEQQKESLATLEKNLKSWHEALVEKHHQQKLLLQQKAIEIKKKKKQQYHYMLQVKAEKEILPEVLKKARKQIEQQYVGQQGKDLLTSVVTNLTNKATVEQ